MQTPQDSPIEAESRLESDFIYLASLYEVGQQYRQRAGGLLGEACRRDTPQGAVWSPAALAIRPAQRD